MSLDGFNGAVENLYGLNTHTRKHVQLQKFCLYDKLTTYPHPFTERGGGVGG